MTKITQTIKVSVTTSTGIHYDDSRIFTNIDIVEEYVQQFANAKGFKTEDIKSWRVEVLNHLHVTADGESLTDVVEE